MISYHFRFFLLFLELNLTTVCCILYYVLALGFTLLINDGLLVFHQRNSLPKDHPPERHQKGRMSWCAIEITIPSPVLVRLRAGRSALTAAMRGVEDRDSGLYPLGNNCSSD